MASAQDTNSATLQEKVTNSIQSTANAVQNHPTSQKVKETLTSGPVADKIKEESSKTKSEFQNVADSRKTPSQPAATGQPLTHYHSFFYNILSWENPRITASTYASITAFILFCRYFPVLSIGFRFLYTVLSITMAVEGASKLLSSQGLSSSVRPKRYYTIPRETLEASLEDLEQLINFFVIESQRIFFVENITHTITACVSLYLSYYLLKVMPLWGLSLIGNTVVFFAPLIYVTNKELIDEHMSNAQDIASAQTTQMREIASHHTANLTETVKSYTKDYTAMAQDYIGSARRPEPAVPAKSKAMEEAPTAGPGSAPKYQENDFPHAPKQEPVPGVTSHQEQYENSPLGAQAVPAS